jgi:hypothetical protein
MDESILENAYLVSLDVSLLLNFPATLVRLRTLIRLCPSLLAQSGSVKALHNPFQPRAFSFG